MTTWPSTIVPSFNSGVEVNHAVRTIQYGNGYSLRIKDGINSKRQVFDLNFDHLTDADLATAKAFIDATEGYQWFYWTPPFAGHGTQIKVRAAEYKETAIQYNDNSFRVTFTQTFDP